MKVDIDVGQEVWFVATGADNYGESGKEEVLARMMAHPALNNVRNRNSDDADVWSFDTLDGNRSLTFGSFDNLMRLTDDLAKFDSQLDTIIHRLERQQIDLVPKPDFQILSHNQKMPFDAYFRNWKWDEAKFPRSRTISDTFNYIVSLNSKLDEECRTKLAALNEMKSQHATLSKKDGQLLTNRELVDVLTPETVKMTGDSPDDDFIYTEHFTTVVVILPRGAEAEFLKEYMNFAPGAEDLPMIVPMSAKPFPNLTDKEGNMLYRVVMFKAAAEAFKKTCRERRYIVRDFEFDAAAYKTLCKQRAEISDQVTRQHHFTSKLLAAAWSDAVVGMMHIKAMRIFVESVLRFGMPPKFASFVVKPKASSQMAARRALTDILGWATSSYSAADGVDDGEEYFPYVSFTFCPFTVPRG